MNYPTIEQLYDIFLVTSGVNTDTRKIEFDELFISLKGENFNGNEFADLALDNGALYAIVDEEEFATSDQHILVKNGLETLQELAIFHRKMLDIPVIGITGSNGKTTTKELIAAVLNTTYKCFFTKGNLNNHIGVPLSILSITPNHEIAVIEMGANHLKEIEFLSKISQPDFGLITNIGSAHIEGFGSKENIKQGKGELYEYIKTTENKTIFINSDDSVLMQMSKGLNLITYGIDSDNINGELISNDQFLTLRIEDYDQDFIIQTQLVGEYNFYNALAAVAIGRHLEVPLLDAVEAIESYKPDNNRSQLVKKGENKYIVDAYNANPSSMAAAIKSFSKNKIKNKLCVLGHMLELGTDSAKEHQEIISLTKELELESLFVGEGFEEVAKIEKVKWVATVKEAKQWIEKSIKTPTTILIKGSRGIKLEDLLKK